ncbi:MAG: M61 family peptidase [Cyclobacteriaceae bacterium]
MRYKLSCVNPLSKRFDISLTIEKSTSSHLELNLSKWRPGRYEFGNFPGHIYNMRATTQNGSAIAVTKKATHQWVIDNPNTGLLTIDYQVYANRLDAGGTFVAEDFWLINPINSLLSVEGYLNREAQLELVLPAGFEVSTSLEKSGELWQASSFDELADSPILASANLERIAFTVGEKSFVIAIQGDHQLDKEKLISDVTKYTWAQCEVLPWDNVKAYEYQFLFFPFKIYHGVEHKDGTTIILGPTSDPQFYENLMGVSSHELFHYWNIKRIRPKQLSPYQFGQENYFDTGYVAEGFTTYYGDLFLVRGGVFDEAWYLGEVTRLLKRHFENYGRHAASLTDSSQDLWIDGYRNEAPHRKVSIYVKGALVAMMFDLTIRKANDNEQSLDDVIKALWDRFGLRSEGYLNEDVLSIAEKVSGLDLSEFFEYYIQGTESIETELSNLLAWVGLKLELTYSEDRLMSYLGLRTHVNAEGISSVISTVPESLGEDYFTAGDEILSINGAPPKTPFEGIIAGLNNFEVIRLGQKRKVQVQVEAKAYYGSQTVSINSDASDVTHHRRAKWLKTRTSD